jgi:hypothetical protein
MASDVPLLGALKIGNNYKLQAGELLLRTKRLSDAAYICDTRNKSKAGCAKRGIDTVTTPSSCNIGPNRLNRIIPAGETALPPNSRKPFRIGLKKRSAMYFGQSIMAAIQGIVSVYCEAIE